MWRHFEHISSFVQRLLDHFVLFVVEPQNGLLKVSDAAMDEFGAPAGRAAGEVVSFDEGCAESCGCKDSLFRNASYVFFSLF